MKGFSSQAGAAFSTADPGDVSDGAETSEPQCNGTSPSAAPQPDAACKSVISSQRPAAQPDSVHAAAQAEHGAEVSGPASKAADSDGASEASAAHANGASASGSSGAGSAHADACASPFVRHVQELTAERGQPGVSDTPASANGSADDDTQNLAMEAPHKAADGSADKGTLQSARGLCSAATCSCGGPDAALSRPTSDVSSGGSMAAADAEQSPTDAATEASTSLQSSPDGQDRAGASSVCVAGHLPISNAQPSFTANRFLVLPFKHSGTDPYCANPTLHLLPRHSLIFEVVRL